MKSIPGNLPPVADDYTAAAISSNALSPVTYPIALSAIDSDVQGYIANYTVTSLPASTQGTLTYCSVGSSCPGAGTAVAAGAVLTPSQAATIAFQPNAAYSGPVSFNYMATDNKGALSNIAVVNIPVVNIAPVTQPVKAIVSGGVAPIALVASDPDNGTIAAYVINTVPPANEGALTYCTNGTLPCSNTTLAGGEKLTPAEAATLKFTPVTYSPVATVAFNYSAIDNTSAQSNMSAVTLGLSTPAPLPVTIQSFTASAEACAVMIRWMSGTEDEIASYTIEQSLDGVAYHKLGRVVSKGSNSSYTYTVNNAVKGKSMYRLEIGEANGSYVYSNTATVMNECEGLTTGVTLMPNPASSTAIVTMNVPEGAYTIRMMNAQGQMVVNRPVNIGKQTTSVRLENLDIYSRGAYIIHITDAQGKRIFTDRLMLH
jgi:hypothetical protein